MSDNADQKEKSRLNGTRYLLIAGLISKVLGFVREMLLAASLGATKEYDTYLVSTSIPGAVSSVFSYAVPYHIIPSSEGEYENRKDALFWVLFSLLVAFISAAAFMVSAFSPAGMSLRVSRLAAYSCLLIPLTTLASILESRSARTGSFNRIAFSNIGFAVFAIAAAGLSFLWPQAEMVLLLFLIANFARILFWGGTAIKSLFDFGAIKPRDIMLNSLIPVSALLILGGELFGQAAAVSERLILASGGMAAGAVTQLYYSRVFIELPASVLSLAVGRVFLSALVKAGSTKECHLLFERGLTYSLYFGLPLAVVVSVGAPEVLPVLIGFGKFKGETAKNVSQLIAWMSPGIIASIVLPFIIQAMLARHKYILVFGYQLGHFAFRTLGALIGVHTHNIYILGLLVSCANGLSGIFVLILFYRMEGWRFLSGKQYRFIFEAFLFSMVLLISIYLPCHFLSSVEMNASRLIYVKLLLISTETALVGGVMIKRAKRLDTM